MKLLIIVLAATLLSTKALNVEQEWAQFKHNHNKSYKSLTDEHERLEIFINNLEKIEQHNKLFEQNVSTYKMGVNQFADMTTKEFQNYLGACSPKPTLKTKKYTPTKKVLAETVDWRNKNAVTPVKNQAECGASWTFATTGALEGQEGIKRTLITLSEQCLIDCATNYYGNKGCSDGWMSGAYVYIKQHGLPSEIRYPYEAQDGLICKYDPGDIASTISSYQLVQGEANLQAAVHDLGPIAVAIEVTTNFQLYSSGILDDDLCSDRLNHCVLVVGYGTEDSDYWLVKNSWGTDWGEQGYIRMSRNKNNQCGIADYGYIPIL